MKLSSIEDNFSYEGVQDVDPTEVFEKLSNLVLVDVRQPEEFSGELGHVPGSKLIVLDTLPEKASEIPKDQTVVLICRSGARSARATAFLKSQGFTEVYNMKGGMLLWNELRLKTEG
ncbi:MAG: rhodanese-like domain-containing protein [Pseudobdellovibrionaceae bacterium]|jgi:rhodanese-related sulfurtransferase